MSIDTDPFTDPDYVALEEIHAVLHNGTLTDRQMIDQIQNHLSAWSITTSNGANE